MTGGGVPAAVPARFGLRPDRIEALGAGLINRTFLLAAGGNEYVLQRVNPMFPAVIHEDIEAVCAHLGTRGITVPSLLRADDGALCVAADGANWRLMPRLPGAARSRLERPLQAESAGVVLGRFHGALLGLRHEFRHVRAGVHDTPRHLARLRGALQQRADHARFRLVAPLAEKILAAAEQLPETGETTARAVHGDPKINNFLFDPGSDRALCLVDFDTLSRMPLPLELGDALRSWCNPDGEDAAVTRFAADFAVAGMSGYARHAAGWITPGEVRAIAPATLRICVELAARFCADALLEDFFGWDADRFGSHSEHSQLRAAGQLALAASLGTQLPELGRNLAEIFAGYGTRL